VSYSHQVLVATAESSVGYCAYTCGDCIFLCMGTR